ncbi:YihY/virulence factor BrkB family protein [Carnobacterium divergens]|nr:YihY/virulence factor BrkB family protein [Carnobacterium divergens]TFI75715.1 ribonuclease BN [Carnobacterium divergens]
MEIKQRLMEKKELVRLIQTIQKKYKEAEVTNSAVIIAYYLLLSFFPILIVVGNLLPLLNLDMEMLIPYMQSLIPEYIFTQLEPTMLNLLTSSSSGLLSAGAIGAIWASSKGMNAMQVSMNKAYGVEPRKNMFVIRLASLAFTLVLILGIVLLVLVFSFGQMILDYLTPLLQLSTSTLKTFQTLKWPVTLLVLFFVFILIYYMVPNAKTKVKNVIPGALFATVGWMTLSQGFAIYVNYFSGRTQSYGTIGTMIVLMLWLNGSGVILTLGAVINASLDQFYHGEIEENTNIVGKYLVKKFDEGKQKIQKKKIID